MFKLFPQLEIVASFLNLRPNEKLEVKQSEAENYREVQQVRLVGIRLICAKVDHSGGHYKDRLNHKVQNQETQEKGGCYAQVPLRSFAPGRKNHECDRDRINESDPLNQHDRPRGIRYICHCCDEERNELRHKQANQGPEREDALGAGYLVGVCRLIKKDLWSAAEAQHHEHHYCKDKPEAVQEVNEKPEVEINDAAVDVAIHVVDKDVLGVRKALNQ